jgi:cytochrome c
MKKLFITAIAGLVFSATSVLANGDGEVLFKDNGCTGCHQPAVETIGPSLKKIAEAYGGNKEELIKFLRGEGKPKVDPGKFNTMLPQLNVTKTMTDAELEALADYILSQK